MPSYSDIWFAVVNVYDVSYINKKFKRERPEKIEILTIAFIIFHELIRLFYSVNKEWSNWVFGFKSFKSPTIS